MGLYHSVGIGFGFEVPCTISINDIDEALRNEPNEPDSVGYIVVGDLDKTLLVTRYERADENTVSALTPEYFARPELAEWTLALHEAAVRIGCPDHPLPTWLVIHNYR